MTHPALYVQIYESFKATLAKQGSLSTREATLAIKQFFRTQFESSHHVLCSHAQGSEYLTDVLVTTFNPKTAVSVGTLKPTIESVSVYLAVESELGGVGASSAYGVMKNTVEDFLKLLVVRAEYLVMVFTSLPYAREQHHVENRVEVLRDLYSRAGSPSSGVLLIHLHGTQPRSTQVQASLAPMDIRGFVISMDGQTVEELHPDVGNAGSAA